MKTGTKTIIVLASFTALAVLALIVAARALLQPEPPFNDDDLQPVRGALDERDNAFAIIQQARSRIVWVGEAEVPHVGGMAEGNPKFPWDPVLAARLLASNPGILALLDEALNCRGLQVPAPREISEVGAYPWLDTMSRLGMLASIQAEMLFREGREQEAFALAFKTVELGRRIQRAGGESFHYLRGSSMKKLGLNRIRSMCSRTTLPADTLSDFAKRLDHYRADTAALTNVLKVDYRLNIRMIEDMYKGKWPGTNAPDAALRLATPKVLKVTATKRLYADCTRACLKSIPHPYIRMPHGEVPNPGTNSSTLAAVLRRNPIGEVMYDTYHSPATSLLRVKCRENVQVAATQLTLALKCWAVQHGTLPQSLTELVPEYLPEVPRDDWDGEPFRYSAERRLIYSVGEDLADDGGTPAGAARKAHDTVFELGFLS